MPNGAGLCVRKKVADYYFHLNASGKRDFVLDRVGSSLNSCGDFDLAACACDLGQGVGLFASMKLSHLIPAERMAEDYLLRLVEAIGYSAVILESFRPAAVSASPGWSSKIADIFHLGASPISQQQNSLTVGNSADLRFQVAIRMPV